MKTRARDYDIQGKIVGEIPENEAEKKLSDLRENGRIETLT